MAEETLIPTNELQAIVASLREEMRRNALAAGKAFCVDHYEAFLPPQACWICEAVQKIKKAKGE